MNWDAFHDRGDVLRAVVDEANRRVDGELPTALPRVAETFEDPAALVSALQMRWHTRLAGQVERSLMEEPAELETAVLTAWRRTASELAGVRAVLDAQAEEPLTPHLGESLARARRKDWVLLAAMAGQSAAADARAELIGRRLEERARAAYDPTAAPRPHEHDEHHDEDDERTRGTRPGSLLGRLRAHLAA